MPYSAPNIKPLKSQEFLGFVLKIRLLFSKADNYRHASDLQIPDFRGLVPAAIVRKSETGRSAQCYRVDGY